MFQLFYFRMLKKRISKGKGGFHITWICRLRAPEAEKLGRCHDLRACLGCAGTPPHRRLRSFSGRSGNSPRFATTTPVGEIIPLFIFNLSRYESMSHNLTPRCTKHAINCTTSHHAHHASRCSNGWGEHNLFHRGVFRSKCLDEAPNPPEAHIPPRAWVDLVEEEESW